MLSEFVHRGGRSHLPGNIDGQVPQAEYREYRRRDRENITIPNSQVEKGSEQHEVTAGEDWSR